ncbi:MAG: cysteine desulfurase [Chitinophagales bacterium]|nr:cysteine desulfurase [Bacteroidota bacterium]MCB9257398.1 cysteine desulfurase [Chitinophagales bacterium]
MKVYLDNAASTRLRPEALNAMLAYMKNHFGNASSVHAYGRHMKAALELSRKNIAKHLNAKSNEIYFCSSGTEANNIALKLSVENLGIQRIISSKVEHKCVLNTCNYLHQKLNVQLDFVKTSSLGEVDFEDLEKLLSQDTKPTLVSLMHVQNELGSINDLEKISSLCTKYQALFHTDTVQSIGHWNFDLSKSNISFLSASAHKFNGPQGIGFLYKRNDIGLGTWLHGGGHERNLRSSTENIPGIVGMASALDLAYTNLVTDKEHILELRAQLKADLKELFPEISFNEAANCLYTILSVNFPSYISSDLLLFQLDLKGIAISGGSACSSGALKASSVLQELGFPENESTLRFSFSYETSMEDIKYLKMALKDLKNMKM